MKDALEFGSPLRGTGDARPPFPAILVLLAATWAGSVSGCSGGARSTVGAAGSPGETDSVAGAGASVFGAGGQAHPAAGAGGASGSDAGGKAGSAAMAGAPGSGGLGGMTATSGELSYPINGANPAFGNNDVYYGTRFALGTLNAGNISQNVYDDASGSNALNSLDGQITNSLNLAPEGNEIEWSAGILEFQSGYFAGKSATINVPANTTVSAVYNGHGWGEAAGILANLDNGGNNRVFTVDNSGTVSATTNWNDGVAAALDSYVNYGDQYITNNSTGNFNASASWYTSGIRALSNGGSVNIDQYGSLNATSGGAIQSPYTGSGWAVGLDAQTYSGNINVNNTGATTGTVQPNANHSSEACGAYIWADGGSGIGSSNGNMTFNNTGTFTANGAPNGAVKGVYCGGNGNQVNVTNSGTITANAASGGFGWALETELDGNGSMNILNTGTLTTNGSSGLYVVSTTDSDPNSGGTGPVRIENWGTIQGGTGIASWAYNGPIAIHDHGNITGASGDAIKLSNSRADSIYIYGTPTLNGTMSAGPAGSTLHLHVPAVITAISGGNGRLDSNLANDGLETTGNITAGGKSYSWNNLTVSGSMASTTIPNGRYKIINRNSGLAMADYSQGTANGAKVSQSAYGGGANQLWDVTYLGNGAYQIKNAYSGLVLDDNASNTANGAVIDQWSVGGSTPSANRQWIFTETDNGWYTISPANAPGSCIDVPNASTSDGTLIQLHTLANADTMPNGGAGQQWMLQTP